MAEGNGTNGINQRDLLLEVRADVKQIVVILGDKADRAEVKELRDRVLDIQIQGSPHAREALAKVETVQIQLDQVKGDAAARVAVSDAMSSYKKWLLSGSGLLGIGVVLDLLARLGVIHS